MFVLLKKVLCSEQIGVHRKCEVCNFLKNNWYDIKNQRHVDKKGREAERANSSEEDGEE